MLDREVNGRPGWGFEICGASETWADWPRLGKRVGLWPGSARDDLTAIRVALSAMICVHLRFENCVAGFPRARE